MTDPVLAARTATAVLAGMRAVMLVDGHADPRELALVDAFAATLLDPVDVSGARFTTDAERRLLARRLLEVAHADGVVTAEERETLREITRAHGVSDALLAEVEATLGA